MADAAPKPPADDGVPVKAPDGSLWSVPKGELSQLPDGAALATPEDIRKDKLEREYGGVGGGAAAAGLGALRGASLGLSDPLIVGLGGERARQALEGYQEANPIASIGGEVAGVVAPALLSGGEGAVGTASRIAGAPARGVAAVGGAVERGALRVLGGEAESVLGRVGQRALTSAVGTGVEGAIYGVGNEISDSAIHNHELTAEKLWGGAKEGALIGAGFGAAAGTLGQLGRETGRALAKGLEGSSLGAWLEKKSLESVGRAAGVNKRIASQAEARSDFDAMRRIWRDEAPGLAGKRSFSQMATEDLAQAAVKGIERDGTRIGSALDEAEIGLARKGAQTPLARDVIADLDRAADRLETSKLGARPMANKLRDLADHAREMAGLSDQLAIETRWSPKQVHEFRTLVDGAITNWGAETKGLQKELQQVRGTLEERVVDLVKQGGGEELVGAYKDAKQKYQAWRTLQTATKNAMAGGASNRFFGMSEQLGGGFGSQVGAAIGATVGPLGVIKGATIGKFVGSMASHLLRTRGDFLAADLLNKASSLAAIQAASASVDNRITSGIRGFLSAAPVKGARAVEVSATKDKTATARALSVAQYVQHLASNDAARQEHIAQRMGDIGTVAPAIAAQMAIKAHSTIFNLAANAPKARVNLPSLTPDTEKLHYVPIEVYRFKTYLSGTEEPLSLLEDMKRGYVSPDKARGVRDNHPEMFDRMRTTLIEMAPQQKQALSWSQKKTAKFVFGVDTDAALTDASIRAMQQSAQTGYGGSEQQTPTAQDGRSQRPIETDTAMYQTETEAISTPP